MSPPVNGVHQDAIPWGGSALAFRAGEQGALMLGDVEEGVQEKFSDALLQAGCLDGGGHPDSLVGARGVGA